LLEQKMNASDWVGPLLLDSAEISRVPPGVPGIYMLMAHLPAYNKFGALYCGQTGDLRVRMSQHCSSDATAGDFLTVRGQFKTYFSAAPVLSRSTRLSFESGLIALRRPPLNRQVPRCARLFPPLPAWAIVN
jgi:predicted GIY-YIG superfamily endonuclease